MAKWPIVSLLFQFVHRYKSANYPTFDCHVNFLSHFSCDKNDFVSMLMMKVDKVPEELAKQYYIDDDDYQELHKGREIISDDEEDMPEKKVWSSHMLEDQII